MANELPDVATAEQTLFESLPQEIYFQKLASLGYAPKSMAEAEALWGIGQDIQAAEQAGILKAAEEAQNPYAAVRNRLGEVLQQAAPANSIKQASAHLARNPALYNAVLALAAHRAEEIAKSAA